MARHEVYTCDRCGRNPAPFNFDLHVGDQPAARGPARRRSALPAVEEREEVRQTLDLCVPCMARAALALTEGMGFEAKRAWIDYALKPAQEAPRG